MKFLGLITSFLGADDTKQYNSDWWEKIVKPVTIILNELLVPIIIILGVAGAIYAITLGVQYSKAESSDKKDEVKKRLINGVIGIVIALILLIIAKIFMNNSEVIAKWILEAGQVK